MDQNPLFPLVTAPTMRYVTQNMLLRSGATPTGRTRLTPAGVHEVPAFGYAVLNVDTSSLVCYYVRGIKNVYSK